jgi:hypothetical protein
MKRKSRKPKQKRNSRKQKKSAARSSRKRVPKRRRQRQRSIRLRRFLVPRTRQQSIAHRKSLAVLAEVRRGESFNKAAKREHIKQKTVLRYVGNALYRSGPNKPWKATKTDRIPAKMTILTEQGPIFTVVKSSVERVRLSRYDIALRRWRGAEDGAEQELLTFKGQTVAGHMLITDPDVLIRLEEAGQLDFDELYYTIDGDS